MTRLMPALFGTAVLAVLSAPAGAAEKPALELTVEVKGGALPWPYPVGPKEIEAQLKAAMKKKGERLPQPPSLVIVLRIKNTGKEKAVIHVEGDANAVTLNLDGPGVLTGTPLLAVTREFRLPQAVELEPGKSHEITLTRLADGFRKAGRYIYPTAPGEYTLSATYQLTNADGGKGVLLKSEPVKLTVEGPKE